MGAILYVLLLLTKKKPNSGSITCGLQWIVHILTVACRTPSQPLETLIIQAARAIARRRLQACASGYMSVCNVHTYTHAKHAHTNTVIVRSLRIKCVAFSDLELVRTLSVVCVCVSQMSPNRRGGPNALHGSTLANPYAMRDARLQNPSVCKRFTHTRTHEHRPRVR